MSNESNEWADSAACHAIMDQLREIYGITATLEYTAAEGLAKTVVYSPGQWYSGRLDSVKAYLMGVLDGLHLASRNDP